MWSASVRWWMARDHVHGYATMRPMLPALWTGCWLPIVGIQLIETLNIERVEAAGSGPVRRDAVVDGDDAHRLDDVAGVEELASDAASSAAPTASASVLLVRPVEYSRTGKMLRPTRTEPRQCQTSPRLR